MKIVWSDFAIANLRDIFAYYSKNAGKEVAHKIKNQILASTRQLRHNPDSGQIETNLQQLDQGYRYLVCGNYKIIYQAGFESIVILDIFDARRDPSKMMDKNRNVE